MVNKNIDCGECFDWGKTSADYAKYRDIYPQEFYRRILNLGLCTKGQKVLDIGTGTGVLPRNLYSYGAAFTGTDISENQIAAARQLTAQAKQNINYFCMPAERLEFPGQTFDVITACQCYFYFDHQQTAPETHRLLKKDGRLAFLYMAWLPSESTIAEKTEALVLKYNPNWSGAHETRHEINIPAIYSEYFTFETQEMFDLAVPFTRETWNGRIKACRGIGASLSPEKTAEFEQEHMQLLQNIAPEQFAIPHYAAVAVLQRR